MLFNKVKPMVPLTAAGLVLAAGFSILRGQPPSTPADNARSSAKPLLNADNFAQLRKQIRPQPGESRWMDIPWLLDLHQARQKAAAEGKPLFIYSGGGATGIGAC